MAKQKRTTVHEISSLTLGELFNREEGEEYLPSCIEDMARDFGVTPERIIIAAVHHLLFGDGRDEFFADPNGRAYRTPTEDEERIDSAIAYLDPDFGAA